MWPEDVGPLYRRDDLDTAEGGSPRESPTGDLMRRARPSLPGETDRRQGVGVDGSVWPHTSFPPVFQGGRLLLDAAPTYDAPLPSRVAFAPVDPRLLQGNDEDYKGALPISAQPKLNLPPPWLRG